MKHLTPSALLFIFGLSSNIVLTQFIEQTHNLTSGTHNLQCLDGTTCYGSSNLGLNKVIKTIDGENWQDASGDLPNLGSFSNLFCFTSNHCIILDNTTSLIYETKDGGTTWHYLSQGGNYINFFNSAVGSQYTSGIELSTDMGQSWYSINSPNTMVAGPFFLTANFGFAITASAVPGPGHQIHRTKDGGSSWELVSEDTISAYDYGITRIEIINENVAYAIGSKGVILKTIDGGTNWVQLKEHPYVGKVFFKALDFIDERYGYVVGGGSVILKTTNGGESWIDESFTFNLGFEAVQVADLNNVYVFGSGYLLKNDSANFAGLFDLEKTALLGKVYPNPALEQVTIELNEYNTALTFKLYSISGQLVKELESKSEKTVLQRDYLESGIYFFHIIDKNEGLISTGKINFK